MRNADGEGCLRADVGRRLPEGPLGRPEHHRDARYGGPFAALERSGPLRSEAPASPRAVKVFFLFFFFGLLVFCFFFNKNEKTLKKKRGNVIRVVVGDDDTWRIMWIVLVFWTFGLSDPL